MKRYLTNGYKKSEAYRYAYDCSRMNTASIYVEASKFFKNPKITLWLDYYRQNTEKAVKDELNYSAMDYFNDCEELKLVFTGDIFVNIKGFSEEQKEFNSIAPFLMTGVETNAVLAKQTRDFVMKKFSGNLICPGHGATFCAAKN